MNRLYLLYYIVIAFFFFLNLFELVSSDQKPKISKKDLINIKEKKLQDKTHKEPVDDYISDDNEKKSSKNGFNISHVLYSDKRQNNNFTIF